MCTHAKLQKHRARLPSLSIKSFSTSNWIRRSCNSSSLSAIRFELIINQEAKQRTNRIPANWCCNASSAFVGGALILQCRVVWCFWASSQREENVDPSPWTFLCEISGWCLFCSLGFITAHTNLQHPRWRKHTGESSQRLHICNQTQAWVMHLMHHHFSQKLFFALLNSFFVATTSFSNHQILILCLCRKQCYPGTCDRMQQRHYHTRGRG